MKKKAQQNNDDINIIFKNYTQNSNINNSEKNLCSIVPTEKNQLLPRKKRGRIL
jgi:hypothetical protein